jgi:hypothetical protein
MFLRQQCIWLVHRPGRGVEDAEESLVDDVGPEPARVLPLHLAPVAVLLGAEQRIGPLADHGQAQPRLLDDDQQHGPHGDGARHAGARLRLDSGLGLRLRLRLGRLLGLLAGTGVRWLAIVRHHKKKKIAGDTAVE